MRAIGPRGLLAIVSLASAACSRSPAEPADRSGAASSTSASRPSTPAAATASEAVRDAAPARDLPLLWDDPPSFVAIQPKTPARAAEYVLPRVGNDPEDGDCVIMTFGPKAGGSVDDNVKRWVDQFHPAVAPPRRANLDVNGMRAAFVEVAGTYVGNMMPTPQGFAAPVNKPGWRMIGAILEAPTGLWFFKLTGPNATVLAGARAFEDMVRSARPR